MKTKQQQLSFFKLTALAVGLLIIAGCSHQTGVPEVTQVPLRIEYFFTAEATYNKIEIDQNRLIYIYFDDAENRCAQWVAQEPCWTEDDLKTKEADLTDKEINDLIGLVRQTGFMQLEKTYGGASELQRFYPYYLKVQLGNEKKEVVYQSYPGSTPVPEAFQRLADRLHELVTEKFQ
jgi:hypothetical protein